MSLCKNTCRRPILLAIFLLTTAALAATARPVTVVTPKKATSMEKLAAREVQRYIYLRTGHLPPVSSATPKSGDAIVISTSAKSLHPQEYTLKTVKKAGPGILYITGGDGPGTLYGAYRFAEHLGFRFDLDRDIVPDGKIAFKLPALNEHRKPLFSIRGIQPFHDFPEGPDWWEEDNYKAAIAQLPKLGMNFIGLHTYAEGDPNAEPTVWIGAPKDLAANGKVKFSYPSSYYNTSRWTWGYEPKKTSDYIFGAGELFDRDAYGPEVQGTACPEPVTVDDCNAVFNRTSDMLKGAFEYAHSVGVKTCVGTQTPLVIPEALQKRLKAEGKDPKDPKVVAELYRGTFEHAAKAYPLDYYWLWTPERWGGMTPLPEIQRTVDDMQTANKVLRELKPPFKMATSGWVIGPWTDRALVDKILPKDVPMAGYNRDVGKTPVDHVFADIKGRGKWAVPWLEDDGALTCLELWAGRMRKDANEALNYGCTGLLGIHWRTRILSPNVASLAQAQWDQTGWSTKERPTGAISGGAGTAEIAVKGTDDPTVYKSVRWGVYMYWVSVPKGAYSVTLKFCESTFQKKGARVFDVRINGKTVIENLDVFDKAGYATALDYTFKNIKAPNGNVEIGFFSKVENPIISGIIVQGPKATKKINCGGPAYKDWQADVPLADLTRPTTDFYSDWATAQFGQSVGQDAARIFEKIDGKVPLIAGWVGGPGGFGPDDRPWSVAQKDYTFADDFAALQPRAKGAANLERYTYWLNTFRYVQSFGRLRCALNPYLSATQKLTDEKDPAARKKLAKDVAVPAQVEVVRELGRMYSDLLASVSTTGELGTIANWEQHLLPGYLRDQSNIVQAALGEPLPAQAVPTHDYTGPTRIIVPALRTSVRPKEALKLKVMILSESQPTEALLYWSEIGKNTFHELKLSHVARGVYLGELPANAATGIGFEYYIKVPQDGGTPVYYPATAPETSQTVIVMPS